MKCVNCQRLKMKFLKIEKPQSQQRQSEKYKLIYFDNSHWHSNKVQRKKQVYHMTQMFEIMQNTPKNMSVPDFKRYIKAKYPNLNDGHVYYMLCRFRRYYQNIHTITEFLKKNKATIWTDIYKIDSRVEEDTISAVPQEDPPFMMVALPKMIYNFNRYGDCCYFMIIRGLVKKKTMYQRREWEIIAFNGLNYHNRFAPFALAFLQVTPQSYEKRIELVKRVFNGFKRPQVFITPHQQLYDDIVSSLRNKGAFNGLHIYDALEELEHIEKIVSDNKILQYFQDIVHSVNRVDYYENVQNFYKNIIPTMQIRKTFNNLQQKAHKMCYALIQTDRFIGMGFKYSANRYMSIMLRYLYTHNYIQSKLHLPNAKELYLSLKTIIKEFIKISQPELPYIKYELWKLQEFMVMPEITILRDSLKKTVLEVFLSRFHRAMTVITRQRTLKSSQFPEMKGYDIYDKNSKAIFVVSPRAEYDSDSVFKKMVWKCSCLYSLKCGMPCEHEIKVLMINGGSLLEQVHERWIEVKIGKKIAPGRPKSTRRNMLH